MYEGVVFFYGPLTKFARKVDKREIIARTREVPFIWLARMQARAVHRQLDPQRCGWAVLRDGKAVEQDAEFSPTPSGLSRAD